MLPIKIKACRMQTELLTCTGEAEGFKAAEKTPPQPVSRGTRRCGRLAPMRGADLFTEKGPRELEYMAQ